MTCTNDPATFSPFVLHGDTVHFEFRSACSAGDGSWGFRFHASPVQGLLWLSEYEVLHACRFVGRLMVCVRAVTACSVLLRPRPP